ncbi:GNAT family N-acetyltransferase [Candidatus Bipolaricaulota bacterium]|nr:GNAT family N-acetyltransferase [Candidatus Bipolaricaulota bacterium]
MIYGGRVRLRAIEREDIPRFLRWLNDPEVRRYLTMYRPLSRAEEERWVESLEVVSHLFAFTPAVSPRS